MEVKEALESLGMEPLEIKVYLFLLKSGPLSQQEISDNGNILRQTVYDLMTKMENKSYVSTSLVKKRKFYSAIKPEILLQQLKEKEEQFKQVLPELNQLSKLSKVNLFSQSFIGLQGLKNLFNLTLDAKTEILWLSNKGVGDKIFQGYYWHNYALKRAEKKIKIKLLIEPTKDQGWNTDKKILRKTKRHSLINNLDSAFLVFDDKIIIYSMDQDRLFGTFIQNSSLAKLFEKIFYGYWKEAD